MSLSLQTSCNGFIAIRWLDSVPNVDVRSFLAEVTRSCGEIVSIPQTVACMLSSSSGSLWVFYWGALALETAWFLLLRYLFLELSFVTLFLLYDEIDEQMDILICWVPCSEMVGPKPLKVRHAAVIFKGLNPDSNDNPSQIWCQLLMSASKCSLSTILSSDLIKAFKWPPSKFHSESSHSWY